MHRNRLVLFTLALLLLGAGVGCAHYTPRIDPDDRLDPQSAYLYGRFRIDAKDSVLGMDSHESMGFAFKCENGSDYTIRFSNRRPLQVIRIKPSRCEFVEIVCTDADGVLLKRLPVAPGTLHDRQFLPGRGYYLGDFYAKATVQTTPVLFATRIRWRWGITDVQNNYQVTTEIMKEKFSNLSRLPTEDRMLGP
jgi:hypothetical protein